MPSQEQVSSNHEVPKEELRTGVIYKKIYGVREQKPKNECAKYQKYLSNHFDYFK